MSGQKPKRLSKYYCRKIKNTRQKLKSWSKHLSNLTQLIKVCNKVILYLDTLEDFRPLLLPEWNFRVIIKAHLQVLLRYKNIYWKKRFTANRIKLGDENTKFFHAMATVSYRRNAISQIKDEQGNWISDHEGKAALLYTSYKNRMGISLQPQMHFDLANLIQSTVDLDFLVSPFTTEEIDHMVKLLPIDKAPGPDGFNGLFLN